ncbi:hypothetical protein NL676_018580 [Syzygium grande]|nr:hypothetical protein NL676_018580 [Syzygium grande]
MRVRKNNSKPINLYFAIAPEEAMNNEAERSSRGLVPEDERAQPNVACEPFRKLRLAEEAPRVAHAETLDPLSNFKGKRLKHHNEEPSSMDRQNALPNPCKRTTEADPRGMHFIRQQLSSSTPTTSKFAHPTSTTTRKQQQQQHPQQQRRRPNRDTRLSSPGKEPCGIPIENPGNLQSAGSPHNASYVRLLQSEMRRISEDKEKMRHEMEGFQSSVSALQSQIEQRRREIEALQSENDALRKENEALRRDSS